MTRVMVSELLGFRYDERIPLCEDCRAILEEMGFRFSALSSRTDFDCFLCAAIARYSEKIKDKALEEALRVQKIIEQGENQSIACCRYCRGYELCSREDPEITVYSIGCKDFQV